MCYGDPEGYSAMAKTVGFPCAIATRYIINLEMYTLIEHFLEGIALLRLWYLLQVYLYVYSILLKSVGFPAAIVLNYV